MPYTQNPHMPKVRRDTVRLVKYRGWSIRKAARYQGVHPSTVMRWTRKDPTGGWREIPTRSSRPKKSPRALPRRIVEAIIRERSGRSRCAEVVHHALTKKNIHVSLSSVKRTLDRCGLTKKRSPWKRPHDPTPRPDAAYPGALLEADTIHIMLPDGSRLYVYTLIDLFSRWAYAEAVMKIGAGPSATFLMRAVRRAPFPFTMIQTDHGSEFSTWFTHACMTLRLTHRHSRVRQSNDNAHIERFNRTIQEECLDHVAPTLPAFQKAIPVYLRYYNTKRMHMGIEYQTPTEVLRRS